MINPLESLTQAQFILLGALLLNPGAGKVRLQDFILRADTPLAKPTIKYEPDSDLALLEKQKLVRRYRNENDVVYNASLTPRQTFLVSHGQYFQALLNNIRLHLRNIFRGDTWASAEQKTQMGRLLGFYVMTGKTADYDHCFEVFSHVDSFQMVKMGCLQCAFGRLSYYPKSYEPRFFDDAFPFLAWNIIMRGLPAGDLPECFLNFYPNRIPSKHLNSYLAFLVWSGRDDLLEEMMMSPDDTVASAGRGGLAFLAGRWEEAHSYFFPRMKALRNSMSRKEFPPLFVLTAWLAAIRANVSSRDLYGFSDEIRENMAMQFIGTEDFLSSLLRSFETADANMLSSGSPDLTPERLPVFCNVLKINLSANFFRDKIKVPSAVLDPYFTLADKLAQNGLNLAAAWMFHGVAQLAPVDSTEKEYDRDFLACHSVIGFGEPLSGATEHSAWKKALDAVSRILTISENMDEESEGEEESIISWQLITGENTGNPDLRILLKIIPRLQPQNENGRCGRSQPLPIRELFFGQWKNLLTQRERKISPLIGNGSEIPVSAVYLLKNSMVYVDEAGYPVKLQQGKITFRADCTEDGSIRFDHLCSWTGIHSNTVYLDATNSSVCCYWTPDDTGRRISAAFASYGKKSSLFIPKDDIDSFSETLKNLVSVSSIKGTMKDRLLEKVASKEGDVSLYAVLCKTITGDFLLSLRNHPASGIFLVPGTGSIFYQLDDGSVFKRDLPREKSDAEELTSRCSILVPSSSFSWTLNSVQDVLSVLAIMNERHVPVLWQSRSRVMLTDEIKTEDLHFTGQNDSQWFRIGGSVKVDDERILQLTELLELADRNKDIDFLNLGDGKYLRLSSDLQKTLAVLNAAGRVRGDDCCLPPAALPMLAMAVPFDLPEALKKDADRIRMIFETIHPLPDELQASLRPYQKEGYEYLCRMADAGIGCCLADDMGLGKTVQIIALLLREAEKGAALVVAPASVCRNWEAELRRFAPGLHPNLCSNGKEIEHLFSSDGRGAVVIVSYGMLLSREEQFITKDWNAVILDEAQAIKNHLSGRAKAARNLRGRIRIAATGTPIENRLTELWSIFEFLNPGMLGSEKHFSEKFCGKNADTVSLKKLVSPLILRRLKQDVLTDLPGRTESEIHVELSADERTLYETLRRKALNTLKQGGTSFAALAELTKLRRVCCHPSLSKIAPDMEGSKLRTLMELVSDLRESGHKTLVFSQFVDFLHLVETEFQKQKVSYQYLDGSTPADERMTRVNSFQAGQGDFFLISLKAGGTGLNLTAADYVIIADPWWNPAVESQAADRAYRIGQTKPVTIYRLVCVDTVEEKVIALHERKRELAETVLSDSAAASLSADDLLSLLE